MDLGILSINGDVGNKEVLAEMIGKAYDFFPDGLWEEMRYMGNIEMDQDVKINYKGCNHGAFFVRTLIRRLDNIRKSLDVRPLGTQGRAHNLLLGVTYDAVIQEFSGLEKGKYVRVVGLVKDYVNNAIGVGTVSLFNVEEDMSYSIMAHVLGHEAGLGHHTEPIDLMYEWLTQEYSKGLERFCPKCTKDLEEKI